MFTGIVEEVGRVRSLVRGAGSCVVAVEADEVLVGTDVGDSIAVDGVCLTVTGIDAASFSADVMNETLARSSLGALHGGDHVNLERAVALGGRLGGHIVTGHIDGTGTIAAMREDGNAVRLAIAAVPSILAYVVEKGSIAVDGVSLTVAGIADSAFDVSVIPHTRASTTLSALRVGDMVNIECDVIGKYVERMTGAGASCAETPADLDAPSVPAQKVTEASLRENGF